MKRVQELLDRISFTLFSTKFEIKCFEDKKYGGRIYLQVIYVAKDKNTGHYEEWKGRKWYLSEHMLDDEIVKTAYAACKAAVEHEVMESFRVDDKILFNPHTPFNVLLGVSDIETKRENPGKNREENLIESEFDNGLLKSIDVNTVSDLDSEHLFETYKPALDNRCDEACFYHCSKGGQQKPDCIEHYYKKEKKVISHLEESHLFDGPVLYKSIDSLWDEFFKWEEEERRKYLEYLFSNNDRKLGKGWYDTIKDELPIPKTPEESEMFLKAWEDSKPKANNLNIEIVYGTPGYIVSSLDLEVLNERHEALLRRKQHLLSLKKEYRKDLPEVLESIRRIKRWIKDLE